MCVAVKANTFRACQIISYFCYLQKSIIFLLDLQRIYRFLICLKSDSAYIYWKAVNYSTEIFTCSFPSSTFMKCQGNFFHLLVLLMTNRSSDNKRIYVFLKVLSTFIILLLRINLNIDFKRDIKEQQRSLSYMYYIQGILDKSRYVKAYLQLSSSVLRFLYSTHLFCYYDFYILSFDMLN